MLHHAAAKRSLALAVEPARFANREAPLEQHLEIRATEHAEVGAQRANLIRRRGVIVEVHETILRRNHALFTLRGEGRGERRKSQSAARGDGRNRKEKTGGGGWSTAGGSLAEASKRTLHPKVSDKL